MTQKQIVPSAAALLMAETLQADDWDSSLAYFVITAENEAYARVLGGTRYYTVPSEAAVTKVLMCTTPDPDCDVPVTGAVGELIGKVFTYVSDDVTYDEWAEAVAYLDAVIHN